MHLATVISVSPLTVRRDGDAVDVLAKETGVSVVADDRVLTENIDQIVYIIVKVV